MESVFGLRRQSFGTASGALPSQEHTPHHYSSIVTGDNDVQLCCLLWASEGESIGLRDYEDRVLALIPEHGGEVVQRVRSDVGDPHPDEVQIFRFPSQASLDSYLADPRRLALAEDRDRVVTRTELFPVTVVC